MLMLFLQSRNFEKKSFDSKLTNIEDRVWAKNIIKKRFLYFLLCKSLGFPFTWYPPT